MKRTGRIQRTKPFRRGVTGSPPAHLEREAQEEFKVTVCSEPCIGVAIAGHVCDGPLQAMHVVPKQTLKKRELRHLLWDPTNGVAGCYRIHRRHDLAVEKIPRELLPQRAIDFAAKHGLLHVLNRHWPERSAAA